MTGSAPGRLCPKAMHMPNINISHLCPCTQIRNGDRKILSHLHSHLSVIDEHLPRKEVGPNRCLVACAELLVDLLGIPSSASL